MVRYIDADALNKDLDKRWNVSDDQDFCNREVWRAIEDAPTADVVEVKHGKWCEGRFGNGITVLVSKYYICNQCNHTSQKKTSYCPNCGADMRERRDDGEIH